MNKTVTVKVPEEDLEVIDMAAERRGMSRSQFLRESALRIARQIQPGGTVNTPVSGAWAMTADQMRPDPPCSHPVDRRLGTLCVVCGETVR